MTGNYVPYTHKYRPSTIDIRPNCPKCGKKMNHYKDKLWRCEDCGIEGETE